MSLVSNETLKILDDVPDYDVFYTVDELRSSARALAAEYPNSVALLSAGESRRGEPIEVLKIGDGSKNALLFAMPHPNEPIGSVMLEYFARRLAEDQGLRDSLGFTWYLIKCIDPDGTRLNEGWFKGPFSIENYARHFYRPPSFEQVEWTFPIQYKSLDFQDPMPETQALMTLIERIEPDLIYSLHNSGFGGAYFYLSEEAPSLVEPFYDLVRGQDLPLHLGEPEMPFATEFAKAIFALPPLSQMYDFLEEQGSGDPAEVLTGGTSSIDYAQTFCDPFGLVCEMPYFYNSMIHDTAPSDMLRKDAILQGLAEAREEIGFLQEQYDAIEAELTVPSPFRTAIEETLRSYLPYISAQENWARTEAKTAQVASVAEKFDSLVIHRFYRLLSLGMFVRMLEAQIDETGESRVLGSARQAATTAFEDRSAALEADLDYDVIPIQKLVRVQLGSALLAARHAAAR